MFMGTEAVPNGKFDSIMEAEGGQNNGATSEDRTYYFESGPSNLLETFLWLEADRLSTLPDGMNKAKLDLQRDVVKNERRQSYENRPYAKMELVLPEKLYPLGHPYHHPVIGSHRDLSAARVSDVTAFFHTFYVPSNAVLIVAGDFDTARAKTLIEHYFGWMKQVPEPTHVEIPTPPPLSKTEIVTLTDAVELPKVTFAFLSPAWFAPDDAECELLAALLGGGKFSRLYQRLVYERKIAESVEVEQRAMQGSGIFLISAIARKDKTAADLETAITEEVERLRTAPPTDREIERARAFLDVEHLREIESMIGLTEAIAQFDFRFGDPSRVPELLSRYQKIGAPAVATVALRVLSKPHLIFRVVPR